MSNNRTFFKNAAEGQMTLRDIFSDVTRKHTPEESARVFIAGTALTTPDESEMLAGWQKPFLFARFALITLICLAIFYLLGDYAMGGYDPFLACMALMVPMTVLLLAWEMNIPRSISLMEILKIVGLGGALSLIIAIALFQLDIDVSGAIYAPLIEEPAKLAVVYILLKRKNRRYILEGVLLGMAVGTGFAIVETFGYIMQYSRMALIDVVIAAMNGEINIGVQDALNISYAEGFSVALLRATNGIVGHGVYAALYSGGLMIPKGDEEISPKVFVSKDFLFYFGASVLLHALNNSDITGELFPIIDGVFWTYSPIQLLLACLFLLPLLKRGVNQVVEACAQRNGGRVTLAVNREFVDVKPGGDGGRSGGRLEFLSGPLAGQSFALQAGQETTIGRSPSCLIPVAGAGSVSGKHCSVSLNGSMVLITDLGSTNGTYIGSQRLVPQQPTLVPDGGVVYLGSKSCAIRVSSR